MSALFSSGPGLSRVVAGRAALVCVLSLFAAAASADIYRWIDERGTTVISDTKPAKSDKARNVELVLQESKDADRAPAARRKATPTEQALMERIDRLERDLRDERRQAPAYPPEYAAAPPAVTYSTPPYPDAYYEAAPYYPAYYPGYAVYPYAATRPFISRPGFPHGRFAHGGFVHNGFSHGGFARGGGGRGRR